MEVGSGASYGGTTGETRLRIAERVAHRSTAPRLTETEFSAGLTQVKAKNLIWQRSGSRVTSGLGRITSLRHFPYPGVVGLAGLGRITARVTGLSHFPYPGVIGLAGLARVKLV
jgi:hypothetical protein